MSFYIFLSGFIAFFSSEFGHHYTFLGSCVVFVFIWFFFPCSHMTTLFSHSTWFSWFIVFKIWAKDLVPVVEGYIGFNMLLFVFFLKIVFICYLPCVLYFKLILFPVYFKLLKISPAQKNGLLKILSKFKFNNFLLVGRFSWYFNNL